MNLIIVVAHQKGGVGKSTIASNLAVELAKTYEVNVIDLDLQKSLTYFNNIRRKNKYQAFNIIDIQSSKRLMEVINENKNILVVDVGGYDSDINRLAIAGADILITPVSDSDIEIVGLLAFRAIIKELRKKRPLLTAKILFNKIHTNIRDNNTSLNEIYKFVEDNLEFSKFDSILRDRNDYKRAFGLGQSVIEFNKKAANEMINLIEEVIRDGKN